MSMRRATWSEPAGRNDSVAGTESATLIVLSLSPSTPPRPPRTGTPPLSICTLAWARSSWSNGPIGLNVSVAWTVPQGCEGVLAGPVPAARAQDAPVGQQRRRVGVALGRVSRPFRTRRSRHPRSSAAAIALSPSVPPMIRTRPSLRCVAVCMARPSASEPVGVECLRSGFSVLGCRAEALAVRAAGSTNN